MGTVHIFLFKLQCRLELPLVSIIKTFVTRRPFCFCWAERTRLAELKESFLNRLRQNGRRVTKVYCVQIYIVYQLCHLKKRPQFSIVYTFIDHRNDVIKSVQNSSGTTSSRRVVSLQSFEHFMASFLWSIRVQIMENCGLFVKYLSERSIWTSKQGPVVEKMDNAIHRINHYPTDKYQGNHYCPIHSIEIYPVDSAIQSLNN